MASHKACGWRFSSSTQLGRPWAHGPGSNERLCSPVFQDHLLQDACPGAAGRINHPQDLTAPSASRPIAPCCVCFPCLTWRGGRADWLVFYCDGHRTAARQTSAKEMWHEQQPLGRSRGRPVHKPREFSKEALLFHITWAQQR